MRNEELKKKSNPLSSCPFCGGEAEILLSYYNHEDVVKTGRYVKCTRCFIKTPTFEFANDATEAWNTRKPIERILEQLEEEMDTKITVYGGRLGGKGFVKRYYEGLRTAYNIIKEVQHE